jgi:EAL domain-containing protein (putative c-di-GMP-specific phosphodiesterase class I)
VLDAGAVSDKIHRAVTLPYKFRNGTVILDCYIGAAVYPNDAQDKEQLVHNALSAVLEARRRELAFLLYDVHLHGQALRRIYLEGATQRALEEQQFRLVFQPIVDMEYRIVAAEALLRWEHPQMGTIAPYDFIPMAEQTNLISKIGRWVLHRVCEKLAEWERRYDLGVSVNISGKEFSSGDLREEIRTAAACSGLHDLSRLKVEITETTCVRNLEESSRYMRELEELGVQLYIDDFGTGESSLRYLKRIPAGVLKIDKEFVDEIASDPDQLEFLIHIIRMIKARGKRVIVEGVGEEAQAVRLAETACDYMQGFYFSRPLEIEAFEELLAKRRCLPAAED